MPSTVKYALSYPAGTTAPNVPVSLQTSMESVESALTTVDNKNRHAEFTSAAVTTVANTARNIGTLTVDATRTFNNTFATPGTNPGELKILEAGTYAIDFTDLPSSSPGNTGLQIIGVSVVRVGQAFNTSYSSWETTAAATNVYLPANEVLAFNVMIATAQSVGARVRVTKLHG